MSRRSLQRWIIGGSLSALLASQVSFAAPAADPQRDWTPQEFGAEANSGALATAALQRAIDAAHAAGGGRVVVAAGIYLTGTLELRSGVTLHLAKGAELRGSPRIADYRRGFWPALIKARGQTNIGITGEGVIEGQGKAVAADTVRLFEAGRWLDFFPGLAEGETVFDGTGWEPKWLDPAAMARAGTLQQRVAPRSRADLATWRVDEFVRPQLIEFWECRNVRVSGVTLQHAANWVQTYRDCEDVELTHLRVDSTTYWNNDGLDVVNSRRVLIADCDINAADDGICLKSDASPSGRGVEDVTISRCRIRSSASAVKFGTASHVGFRRVTISDLDVRDTYRSALALEAVDGGILEEVKVARVRAVNTGNAIFLRLGQRHTGKPPGALRNIEISDVHVQIPAGKPDEGYEHAGPPLKIPVNVLPSSIVGLPDRPIENVVLRNITLTYAGGGRADRAEVKLTELGKIPAARAGYPEFTMFGELPAWGFFLRDVRGVTFDNVTLRLGGEDFRAAVVAERVDGFSVEAGVIEAPTTGLSVVAHAEVCGDDRIEWKAGAKTVVPVRLATEAK